VIRKIFAISLIAVIGFLFYAHAVETKFLTLTSPHADEELIPGMSYDITWTYMGVDIVNIEYSSDDGENWTQIVSGINASSRSYTWIVPETPSEECYVKIYDATDFSIISQSDSFTIVEKPIIEVTSPNGGEKWANGTPREITWNSTNIDSVKIEVSPYGGTSMTTIVSSTDAHSESYIWIVDEINSQNCVIKVSDIRPPNINDMSDSPFEVYTGIEVTFPNEYEEWAVGSTYEITWNSTDVDSVKIEFTPDNRKTWFTIVSSTDAAAGSYEWTIDEMLSERYIIRVSDASDPEINDECNSYIFIYIALELTSPNGGERWATSTTHDITWKGTNIVELEIEFSPDNGESWSTIVYDADASIGSYEWTIDESLSSECLIRITNARNEDYFDLSDSSFEIFPKIELVSPNGEERWAIGSAHDITWNSTNVDNVKIEFSPDNGNNWQTIISNTDASSESYEWFIDVTPTEKGLIRISDTADKSFFDLSDSSFGVFFDIKPPSEVYIVESPENIGNLWILWNLSPDDERIKYYRIFRSMKWTFTDDPIPVESFESNEALVEAEANNTILIADVPRGENSYIDAYFHLDNTLYYYWVQAIAEDGYSERVQSYFRTFVDEEAPVQFSISNPYPNPFNPATTIQYVIPTDCHVDLVIYDITGKKVAVLESGMASAGIHEVVWDATNNNGMILGSGVYLYKFKAGNFRRQGKVLFLR